MKRTWMVLLFATGFALATGVGVRGDEEMNAAPAPAAAPPPPTSIWNLFGIPKGTQKMRDARVNRRGNNPQWERKDALKRIADPENLESDNPAIKMAAEAKAEADLAPQKIKAIKFLATVCCCCSQYKDEVKKALLAALEDCTEEVRYEAAVALCQCSGDPCTHCNRCSCCDPDIMSKLAELADAKDPDGCYLEASPRVRAAARNALNGCERVFAPRTPGGPIPAKPEGPIERRRDGSAGPTASQAGAAGVRAHLAGMAGDEAAGEAAVAGATPSGTGPERTGWSEVGDDPRLPLQGGVIREVGGEFGLVGYQPPEVGIEQPPTIDTPVPLETLAELERGIAGFSSSEARNLLSSVERTPVPSGTMTEQEQSTLATPDLGGALAESGTTGSVDVQRRSPVAMDPHIRGYKYGQIYTQADGVYWSPARLDLDTMLNKVDPGMIRDVVVIPGPYGLRYGPGFAFIHVEREPTPRHCCFDSEFDTAFYVRGNGGQVYARETISGGGPNFGYRFSYGGRTGSDYFAGNGLKIPSSYESQDLWGELSYDLNPHQRFDFAYQRLDQGYTEYPCQFFNIDNLNTYGFQARLTDTDPAAPWAKLTLEAWYNHTGFRGDTSNKLLNHFPVLQRVDYALWTEFTGVPPSLPPPASLTGRTDGNVFSSGLRAEATFGDPEESHWNLGADFRYLGQRIHEAFNVDPQVLPGFAYDYGSPDFFTNMPRSWLADPGVYAEWINPITEEWTAIVGARLDFVSTRARYWDLQEGEILASIDSGDDLAQDDVLYAFYYTNRWKLNDAWTLTGGFGHAQRPPTLIERYSDGLFLSLAQSGFTRMIGDPHLNPERDWQVDVGLEANQENWRGRVGFFHAWVLDYVTYNDDTVFVPDEMSFADARLLRFVNTRLATLTGAEADFEYFLLPRLTPFARISYVDGRDRALPAPLPAIPPLDTVVGLRLHDAEKGRTWGIELGARIVDDQSRAAWIRTGETISPLEEATPGFTVWNLRGYWNVKKNFNLIGGIDNLFDKTYQEHLDLRLLGPNLNNAAVFPATRVLAPGFTAYAGFNWVF